MSAAKMIYFADVYCPWCYSFAPAMLKLSADYPDIPVHVVGGGLVGQATSLLWMRMREPGLGQFWRSVQEESGRSFAGILADLAEQKDVRMDSFGADAVFMSLAKLAPGHELEQFTTLEDMFFEQGLDLFSEDVLANLASRWRVSAEELSALAHDPAARANAVSAMEDAAKMLGGSAAYPTLYLMRGGKGEIVSQGFAQYETAASRMADITRDRDLEPLAPHARMSRL